MTTTLYRTWRPERFADLSGQEHVARTLLESVRQNRISHGYLLEGTRGTGKTTTARILARAVNCQSVEDGEPCGICGTCRSILDGRNPDVIEVDAASNRGIDDIRDLRERVMYMPVESRRKVYIIDEAHMLTDSAANAFLKTLEEPPPHVIFILCTTEADRLPNTVISRCLRFTFRMLPAEVIAGRLRQIADSEAMPVGNDVTALLARQSRGSMRDANNLLEQLMVAHPQGADLGQAEAMLGLDRRQDALTVARHLLARQTEQALNVIGACVADGMAAALLHRQVLDLLRETMLIAFRANDNSKLSDEDRDALIESIRGQEPPSILRTVRIWAGVNMRTAAVGAEGLLLEMAAAEIGQPDPEPAPAPPRQQQRPDDRRPPPRREDDRRPPPRHEQGQRPPDQRGPDQRSPAPRPERQSRPQAAPDSDQGRWEQAVRTLQRVKGQKFNIGALLRDCDPSRVAFNGDRTRLILPFRNKANLDRMNEELSLSNARHQIMDAVAESFGERYDFDCVMAGGASTGGTARIQARRTSDSDPANNPLVKAAMGLGARIVSTGASSPDHGPR